jgi:hypothetical protein
MSSRLSWWCLLLPHLIVHESGIDTVERFCCEALTALVGLLDARGQLLDRLVRAGATLGPIPTRHASTCRRHGAQATAVRIEPPVPAASTIRLGSDLRYPPARGLSVMRTPCRAARHGIAHRRPFQRQPVRPMNQPVTGRISDGGLAERGVPRYPAR